MTDYKALAERVINEYTVTVCDRNTCDESGYHAAGITKAAAVLREALTPEWKDVPDELPEGAVRGLYVCLMSDGRTTVPELLTWSDASYTAKVCKGELQWRLLAAFDARYRPVPLADNPVANGEVI